MPLETGDIAWASRRDAVERTYPQTARLRSGLLTVSSADCRLVVCTRRAPRGARMSRGGASTGPDLGLSGGRCGRRSHDLYGVKVSNPVE